MAKTTYSEKLKDPRWQKKRLEIMQRDYFTCQECGDNKNQLHIHHKTYKSGNDPWDYRDDNFETLCNNCHALNHNKIVITENEGIVDPQDIILKFGKFSRCVAEIGNHEGEWTIVFNELGTPENILRFIALLMGYAWFDCQFIFKDKYGHSYELEVHDVFATYPYYFGIGKMMNQHSDDYSELIDIDKIYNNPDLS